jgi:hypothetical protein
MTRDDVKDRLYDWASAALGPGASVMFTRQPSASSPSIDLPARPFCTIDVGADRGFDDASVSRPEGDLDDELIDHFGRREFTARFRIFADDDTAAGELIELLRRGMQRASIRMLLKDLAIVRELGAIEATAARGGVWEGRSQLDIAFAYSAFYTDDPGIIERTAFDGEADGYEVFTEIDLTQ